MTRSCRSSAIRVRSSSTARRCRSAVTRANSTASAAFPANEATTRRSSSEKGGLEVSRTAASTPTTSPAATSGTTTDGRLPSSTDDPPAAGSRAGPSSAPGRRLPARAAFRSVAPARIATARVLELGDLGVAVHRPHREPPSSAGEQQDGGVGAGELGRLRDDELGRLGGVRARQQAGGDLRRGGEPRLPPAQLLEEPGVLDRDPGRGCQGHHDVLVALGELPAAALLRQIEVPEHGAADRTGTPRNVVIGGWFGGNPTEPPCLVRSAMRSGRGSRMRTPRMPCPVGRSPIARPQLVVDPGRDELAEPAVATDHAEGAVLRVRQVDGEFDDAPEGVRQAEVAGDRHDGVEQPAQPVLDVEHVLRPGHELAQEGVEPQAAQAGLLTHRHPPARLRCSHASVGPVPILDPRILGGRHRGVASRALQPHRLTP